MLPEVFIERFSALCPEDLLATSLNAFDHPKQVSFRFNKLKVHSEQIPELLDTLDVTAKKIPWFESAYICPTEEREKLSYSALAEDGIIYIQSLSSMLAPILLAPEANETNLDLAAAPGGKTMLMAEMMNNQGQISAVEPVKNRFFRLKANLERMGVENTKLYMKDGRAVGSLKPEFFDRVLLDAPCSSESRFKSYDESSMSHWSLKKVAECAKKQKRLILSAFDALKPGGTMMYCTCSYSPEENEKVVEHLLKRRDTAIVLPAKLPIQNHSQGITEWAGKTLNPECEKTLRVWPTTEMDGFFLALIRKQ